MEAAHHIRNGQTQDHKEAVKAFVDKREPEFSVDRPKLRPVSTARIDLLK